MFNIIAYDGGAEPKSDYLKVTVLVTDDNDNSPVFAPEKYEFTINEDARIGATVGQVSGKFWGFGCRSWGEFESY